MSGLCSSGFFHRGEDCDNYADRIYVVIAITLVASALITCIPVYRVRYNLSPSNLAG